MKNIIKIGEDELVLSLRYTADVYELQEYAETLDELEKLQQFYFVGARMIADSLKRTADLLPLPVKRPWWQFWKPKPVPERAKYDKYTVAYLLTKLDQSEIYEYHHLVLDMESDGIKKKVREMENQSDVVLDED